MASILIFGKYAFKGLLARALALLPALACLAGANSGGGYVVCAAMICFSMLLIGFVVQPPQRRGLYILTAILAAVIAVMLRDVIEASILYVLEKNSGLSGRTLLWYYVLQIAERTTSALIGSGYFVGFFTVNSDVSGLLQNSFISAHNGYLETFVYMGYLGLAICVASLLWLAYTAFRQMLDRVNEDTSSRIFPLAVIMVVVLHNFVESTIVLPNNLNALLLAMVAGMLAVPEEAGLDRAS